MHDQHIMRSSRKSYICGVSLKVVSLYVEVVQVDSISGLEALVIDKIRC